MSRILKKILKVGLYTILLIILFVIVSNVWIVTSTYKRIHSEYGELKPKNTALVLGTSKSLKSGRPNPFFKNRIDAAVKLFNSGKIKHLIVSGDNRTKYYNEPADMLEALSKAGISRKNITLDYAGLRTFDSIIRCKKIFGQHSFYIITQEFHAYRALFIADYYDINAGVYLAKEVNMSESINVLAREILARPKAILDLYLLKETPEFLGKKEKIRFYDN